MGSDDAFPELVQTTVEQDIFQWFAAPHGGYCAVCGAPALAGMRITTSQSAYSALLCHSHATVALAQVGGVVRSESKLRSLGDAVRSGWMFRRPIWGNATHINVSRRPKILQVVRLHANDTETFGDWTPSPEDTWAMDYELSDRKCF